MAISTIGYGIYIRSTLKKQTKPHLFSWAVWTVLMFIVFFAQLSKGGGAGAWVTGFSAAACLIIAGLAVTYGERNITKSDWFAFVGAIIIIPVWYFTQDPLWAVILATAVDAMAYYPTFRKSYLKPYEENFMTYSIDISKWIVALFALGHYSATTMLYPVFLLLANSALVSMILWQRSRISKSL